MPSLKDLRNRIASVKATQKITKAMQMVAAAKLRRAQTAAEAARPYAERMETVLANLASGISGGGPPLLAGTGKSETHLLVVCTAERGLCGAFNSSIVRLARERILALQAEGKTVKIICIGKKGYEQLKRQYRKTDHRTHRPALGAPARLRQRRSDRQEDHWLVRRGRVRRRDPVLLALPLGDRSDPDGAAAHSGRDPGRRPLVRRLRIRARRGRNPRDSAAAQHLRADLPRVCWKTPLRSRARA